MRYSRLGGYSVALYDLDRLKAEQDRRDAEEKLRLFYVAATRAQRPPAPERRHPGQLQSPPKPTTSVLARIVGSLGIADAADGDTVVVEPPSPRPGLEAEFAPGGSSSGATSRAPSARPSW